MSSLNDDNENDTVEGRKFQFLKSSIVVFDKGSVDYQWCGTLTKQGGSCITRLRPKAVYEMLERKDVNKNQGILSDQVTQLNSAHALKRGAAKLCRVGFSDRDSGKFYMFLTNNVTLSAAT